MAAPTLGASGASMFGSGMTCVWTALPTHATNDILILCAGQRNATGTHTATAGWTKITENATGGIGKTSWWWKRATSSSEGNPTVTSTVSSDFYGHAHTISGCITTGDPWDVFLAAGFGVTDPNTISSSAITTTVVDTLVAAIGAEMDNVVTSVTVTATDPSSLGTATSTSNRLVSNAGGADGVNFIAAASKASTGSTGNFTLDWDVAPDGGNVLFIAFKEPGGPPVPKIHLVQGRSVW